MQANYMISDDPLSLDRIRSILTRLEDTIIFSLIERAQFAHNPKIYERGAFQELREVEFSGSWLEWFLKEIETFHAKARRYTSPDEYPFSSGLPQPVLPPLKYPTILYPNTVNVNASIQSFYTRHIVSRITRPATLLLAATKRAKGITGDAEFEDDGNYGSSATIDVEILQAISKRVHYGACIRPHVQPTMLTAFGYPGKFVSESKFRDDPAAFIPHIKSTNRDALAALITKPEVERRLLQRLRKKATLYAQDVGPDGEPLRDASIKIEVDGVVDLYESYIIPLTKEVEVRTCVPTLNLAGEPVNIIGQVEYLLQRLDGMSEEEIATLSKQTKRAS
ncbi:hypothetical protein EVG20_g6139 [Dentipellis fragilis]|uniref:chorismate mutase n=1 Tax=Dentipellis fragilis TaxID=205917 RepID=A0A4Y9YQD7_9AGAM|nr:hypothetical protein EVG20_g6139 [Dentipellis fragilis]